MQGRRPFLLGCTESLESSKTIVTTFGTLGRVVDQGLPIDKSLVHKDWNGDVKCALGTYPLSDPKWIRRQEKNEGKIQDKRCR